LLLLFGRRCVSASAITSIVLSPMARIDRLAHGSLAVTSAEKEMYVSIFNYHKKGIR
jgi:hypothetical protein